MTVPTRLRPRATRGKAAAEAGPEPDETQEPDAEPVVLCNPEKREAWGATCPHTNGHG
ncbi:hypothetical protein ABZ281_22240 [Streptomyces sp. NPDC006265]|uniref:hypothetical protein n=1 Tax=Streptomyces sp. NPDC006265 TaxID=3156740 RepID=UPI0033A6F503